MTQSVLIADDDRDDFETLQEALSSFMPENKITWVKNGEELLGYLTEHPYNLPDLILLDINMPKINGMEALKRIKLSAPLSKLPVIMYTTSQDRVQMKECSDLGANGFITKPCTFDDVQEVAEAVTRFVKQEDNFSGKSFDQVKAMLQSGKNKTTI